MSHSSPPLALEVTPEPPVLIAARSLTAELVAREVISRRTLNRTMNDQFGGSDAEGRWSVRDANAALEPAQVLWLQASGAPSPAASPTEAVRTFDCLDVLVPSQNVRSDEQIELQQFATRPRQVIWCQTRRPTALVEWHSLMA